MVITVSPLDMAASQCKLPVFEPVRARVTLPLLARRNVEQLASILSLDPVITAELLAAANQPKYGYTQRVYTAAEAIRVLGWAETESVIMLAFDEQVRFKAELQTLIRAQWAHSLACAVAATQVSHFLGIPEERAFAFGMLHDIGAWGLMAASPDAYTQVVRQGSRTSIEKLGAEECMMGIDHCKAGKWLVNSWRLPDEFAEAAAAGAEMTAAGARNVSTLINIACRWADALGFCAGHTERIGIRDAIGAAPAHIAPDLRAASAEIGQKCRAKLLEYARGFDADTAKLFGKL